MTRQKMCPMCWNMTDPFYDESWWCDKCGYMGDKKNEKH